MSCWWHLTFIILLFSSLRFVTSIVHRASCACMTSLRKEQNVIIYRRVFCFGFSFTFFSPRQPVYGNYIMVAEGVNLLSTTCRIDNRQFVHSTRLRPQAEPYLRAKNYRLYVVIDVPKRIQSIPFTSNRRWIGAWNRRRLFFQSLKETEKNWDTIWSNNEQLDLQVLSTCLYRMSWKQMDVFSW